MLNLTELMDIGCAHTVTDSDGWMYPCGKPIVAIRRWPEGDGESFGGVCQRHAKQAGAELVPLENVPQLGRKETRMAMSVKQKDKEQVEYLRELVHDINESLERYGNDIPENKED